MWGDQQKTQKHWDPKPHNLGESVQSVKGWKHYHILQVKESYKNTNVILTFLAVMEKGQLDEGF